MSALHTSSLKGSQRVSKTPPSKSAPEDGRESVKADVKKSVKKKVHQIREYKVGEEIANALSHGMGVLLAICALVLLVIRALDSGGGIYLFSGLVFGITLLVEYTMSTLYHALVNEKAKKVFKVLDHSGIYLLIAGSYTPVCLITLEPVGGTYLAILVWAVAIAGVATEAFWVFRPRWLSAVLYLLMGWCVVWFIPALVEALPTAGLLLFFAGGISYTVGCIFYVLKKIPYMHSIFHLFVLAGSICQFMAIAFYVL
jgi:hemolysin III